MHFRDGLAAIGTALKQVRNEVKQPKGLRAGRSPRPGVTAAATSHARRLLRLLERLRSGERFRTALPIPTHTDSRSL